MPVKVMIVDDTAHVRRMLVDMFTLDGFDVVADCDRGEDAAGACVETEPDVVVMDLRMPGMDGLAATRAVRAARPEQVVILYTAYVDAAVESEARAAGAALCLAKIDGLPQLENEVARLAALTRAASGET